MRAWRLPDGRVAYVIGLILFAALYWLLGSAGLLFGGRMQPTITTVWPASGYALAVLLVFGNRYWPAIFAGALLVGLHAGSAVLVATGYALGNCLEALLAVRLMRRYAGDDFHPDRLHDAR